MTIRSIAQLSLFLAATQLVSCSNLKQKNQRGAPIKDLASGDQSGILASDSGCKAYFEQGKDASLDAYDLNGNKHPLCSVLTEASINYLFLMPYEQGCSECLDAAVAMQKAVAAANLGSQVKVVLLAQNAQDAKSADLNLGDMLLFSDDDGVVLAKLSALGYQVGRTGVFALGKTRGSLFSFDAKSDATIVFDALGLKGSSTKTSETAFDILTDWDGRSNISDPEISVEQL